MNKEQDIKITNHVKMTCKSGKLDELLRTLDTCADSSRQEKGCEYHEVIQSVSNPLHITLIEKFSNYDEFKAHFSNPVIRKFIDTDQYELLDKMSNSVFITRINCKGTKYNTDPDSLSYSDQITS